ncbi:hypothetical protein [Streptomyces albogriseolus]|uniref:hypothetical protein n=1 Tax=Streptomyces albogriseolus TaxID=1887 RepID=UPI003F49E055
MLHPMRLVGLGLERSLPRARVVGDWWTPLLRRARPLKGEVQGADRRPSEGPDGRVEVCGHRARASARRAADAPGRAARARTPPGNGDRKLTAATLGTPLLLEQSCGIKDDDVSKVPVSRPAR